MNLLIFGPPGAGKGTQAHYISKKFNLYQLSMGDLLRNEVKNKTEIGKKIDEIISSISLPISDLFLISILRSSPVET